MSRIREQKRFILVNRDAPQYIHLLFYLRFISPFLFPCWCGYMACFHFKINTCLVIYGSYHLQVRMNEAEVLYFHTKLWDAARNEVHHRTSWKCYCVCVGLQNKMHMFREYFLPFTTSKITEKVKLTKKATGKTSAIICRCYDNCLDAANLYSGPITPSTKTCVF